MIHFRQCRYSAFISYAHADDEGRGGWITAFTSELERALRNRLGRSIGMPVPAMHLSGKDGPVGGSLSVELKARVAESYAMIIVVHDNYVQSEYCLKELAYFKSLYGDEGFLDRLYVIAMSEPAIHAVTTKPAWKSLMPFDDQLWLPFYRDEDHELPARVRLDCGEFSQRFETQFERLLKSLIGRITEDCARPDAAPAYATRAEFAPGTQVAPSARRLLFGVASPELADSVSGLATELAHAGVAAATLDADALNGDFPEFDTAEHLVLAFSDGGQPLKPFKFIPGGHLAAQRDAWLGKGRPAAGVIWLDLREVACTTPAGPGHAALVAEVAPGAIKPAALRARFSPPAAARRGTDDGGSTSERVNIYIESNQNEIDLWDPLGEQIKRKWDELVQSSGMTIVPPLHLHARGLPVDRMERYSQLDDADGVVLLWGQKTEDSVRATITKVESKLTGDVPPGIVAFLMPPHADPKVRVEANYWKVLRFAGADSDNIDVVPDEGDLLQAFLRKILARTTRKRQGAVPSAADAPR